MPRINTGYGSWAVLKITHLQLVRAEPGRQTHFDAFQFKISAFCIATHSLFGSGGPNHHSIFGEDKVIRIPISPKPSANGSPCP